MPADFFYALLPEQLLLALLVTLMLCEILGRGARLAGPLFTLVAGAGCAVLLLQLAQGYGAAPVPGEIVIDRFALLGRLVILGCGCIYGVCCLSSDAGIKSRLLLGASLLGALVMLDSAGFISLFLGIELLSLPAFALMVHRCGLSSASEGAFKYLLLSAVASGLILFGLSLGYGSCGTLAIGDFVAATADGPLGLAACALVLSGFFLKAAVFPFHGWAPDAYAGARLPVTALLASIVKGAVVLALVRILGEAPLPSELDGAIIVLAVLSIFYGNVTAIRQGAFRRLLAYSSIAHGGYMIFALADAGGGRVEALLYYVAVYAVTTIVACTCFGLLAQGEADELEVLDGAFAARPLPALLLAVSVLSLAGIPPLPGFLAKFFIFKSVIASGHLVPAVLAFAGSYLGVVYYLGIVYRLFRPATAPARPARPALPAARWAFGGMLLGSAVLMLFMVAPGVFHRLLGGL
ncbi:NADH-quinone oxidoreductase subunit N [Desulfuromonas versatilis]|uniref:NADH-quinone oxidoreductase subunit N n=1 Tax=Desulfuromonas versatilis TaxID=2802975 RepID=A0ABN6DZZ5_9BACT|nr:proton-conducting transporter membrane subunit [Desulfuromonas versatilis]BCR05683.1 NADH-quinone oxidoreductase subunit N [Desulfuromonas versatilis]